MGAGRMRQVHFLAAPEWVEGARGKAGAYGLTLSALTRLAVEAYARVRDEGDGEPTLVAVNYAAWARADAELARCRAAVGGAARSLNSIRASLASARGAGAVTPGLLARHEGRLDRVEASLRDALACVRACGGSLDRVAGLPHVFDPYVGGTLREGE